MQLLAIDGQRPLIDFVDAEQKFCSFRAPGA